MKKKWKNLVALLLFLFLLVVFLWAAGAALTPLHSTEGILWHEYLAEERDSLDVLFVGSSYVFCDVIPAVVYDNSGYTSYAVGCPQLPPSLLYYYVRQAFSRQSPDVVFIELSNINSGHTVTNPEQAIGFLPYNPIRLAAALDCAEPSHRTGLLFPLYSYHDRWRVITLDDIRDHLSKNRIDMLAGYKYLDQTGEVPPAGRRTVDPSTPDYRGNVDYMRRTYEFCVSRGAEVVFYLMPNQQPLVSERVAQIRADTAFGEHAHFFDASEDFAEIGLDNETDFLDPAHLNFHGAERFSRYLADMLREEYAPYIGERQRDDALWRERVDFAAALHPKG